MLQSFKTAASSFMSRDNVKKETCDKEKDSASKSNEFNYSSIEKRLARLKFDLFRTLDL